MVLLLLSKVTQKHFCQQSQQKCRQSATVCALAEGISAAADVFRLWLHTQAENLIFACYYGKYEVKLSQYLILPIGNPSFHSVIAVSICVDGVAVMDTTPLSKRPTQPSHTVTHWIYFQTKILCVCLRASVCLNTVFRIH